MAVTTLMVVKCPKCGAQVDAHAGTNDPNAVPKAGDWSICALCSSLNIFNADFTQRIATREEIDALDKDFANHLCKAIRVIEAAREKMTS